MRAIPLLIFMAMTNFCCQTEQKPKKQELVSKDSTTAKADSFFTYSDTSHFTSYGLKAALNGKTHKIIDTSEHLFIQIVKEMDFDSDGFQDVLVSYSESGGGNCCGAEYFFVSHLGNGKFVRSEKTANSFNEPKYEKWEGKESIVIQTTNSGVNNDDYQEVNNRYILKQGKLIKVEEMRPVEIKAEKEIRARVFSFDKTDEIHTLEYDLDNDTKMDTIICSFYHRWGQINWKVQFGNGKKLETDFSAKRVGILSSETKNVHDIVLDLNTILTWDGERYE
jgi:hypothetical protein